MALSASVFLISRVKSDELAFSLLALALCFFCFWPLLRNLIFLKPFWNNFILIFLTILLCPLSIISLNMIGTPLAIIHGLLHIFLLIICPILLVKMQRYKRLILLLKNIYIKSFFFCFSTIHGPWDEASVKPTTKLCW